MTKNNKVSTISSTITLRIFKNLLIILFFTSLTVQANMAPNVQQEFAEKSQKFAIKFYGELLKSKPNENIIYSPFSIQTCVAMARMGATGETAAELDRGLGLVSGDINKIADTFYDVLSAYKDSSILKIANKIYVMQGYKVQKQFNELVSSKFLSSAEEIDFNKNVEAAGKINHWVESKTNNLIKDLILPTVLTSDTRMVLLNAIHFKGMWRNKFPKHATHDDHFYLNENDSVQVPMMNVKDRFLYADLPDLDATALEMAYEDSDLSMLVILPNSRTGLAALEDKLKNVVLSDITNKLTSRQVIVKFPKFRAEFSAELNEPLMNLGMKRMFQHAEFSNMLETDEPLTVSKVIHKAFIEVNEEGTEAAAATVIRILPVMGFRKKRFMVDHPFVYIMKSNRNIPFFLGRFLKSY